MAQSAYDRAQQLSGRGYTEAEVEAARASLAEAKATLEAAKAALKLAQTELSWTTITSPIAGRADVSTVSVGDLVTAGQSDELTTIVRADLIYVDMAEALGVSLSAFMTREWETITPKLARYGGTRALKISGEASAGLSSGEAMAVMEELTAGLDGSYAPA